MTNTTNTEPKPYSFGPQIICAPGGTHVIYDKSARRFINNSWWNEEALEILLGLDKPKNRIKSLTTLYNENNFTQG